MNDILLKFKNIISLLENKTKKKFDLYIYNLLNLYSFGCFRDGLIIPILTLITSGEINQNFLNYIPIEINNFKNEKLILIVLIFFFVFYIFKSALELLRFGITEDLFIKCKRT